MMIEADLFIKYSFVYLAAWGLGFGTQDLCCGMENLLTVVHGI